MPIEAAACGAIPISLKGTATAEFVSQIDERLVVENSIQSLSMIVVMLVSDSILKSELKAKSTALIKRKYDNRRFLTSMTEFYEEVIERSKQSE